MFERKLTPVEYGIIAFIINSESDVIDINYQPWLLKFCEEVMQVKNLYTGQAASSWIIVKDKTTDGAMSAKLSVNILDRVTTGLAKLADGVNQ